MKGYTNGDFALGGVSEDLGDGIQYIDAHEKIAWLGARGARQACAYYVGVAFETKRLAYSGGAVEDVPYAHGGDDEDFLFRVQAAYMVGSERHRTDMMHWEQEGSDRVRAKAELDG